MKSTWMLAAFGGLIATACAHQADVVEEVTAAAEPAQVEAPAASGPEVVEVAPGISMLMGNGGNIGLLSGDDGAFVIDDQYPDSASGNLAAIERIAGEAPRFLVNTHWHGDHSGGNAAFAGAGATIFAHENARARITGELVTQGFAAGFVQPDPVGWPVVTFADGVTFHLNGQTIEVFKVPSAHTDGDSFIHFREANVLHMGDVFFNGAFPVIDLGSGGSVLGYLVAQRRALDLVGPDTKIIPGHGPLGTKADLEKMHELVEQTIAAVKVHIDAGDTLEETLAANPLAEWDAEYGQGFMNTTNFTTILYTGLRL